MDTLPIRLSPGADLRRALQDLATGEGAVSAFVVCGIGSLGDGRLRFAGEPTDTVVPGPLEIVSLSGTLTASGVHLHMVVSDASGRVTGGHVGYGNVVRTTAEILVAVLPEGSLSRAFDPATGYPELVIHPPGGTGND